MRAVRVFIMGGPDDKRLHRHDTAPVSLLRARVLSSGFPLLQRGARMAVETTQALAGFAATLKYEQVPERAREHCKNLLLDAVACALAGHKGEETAQVAALAAALAQSDESSVIGGGRCSLAGATLLDGYLITAVTMWHVHRPTPHPL